MSTEDVAFVVWCIEHDIHKFYTWIKWEHKRKHILASDHGECQRCKSKGRYTKATTVHHVQYVRKHPELALEEYYIWQGKQRRNLISLCATCHEEEHGHRRKQKMQVTVERW